MHINTLQPDAVLRSLNDGGRVLGCGAAEATLLRFFAPSPASSCSLSIYAGAE
jgi:hypothetical protein